MKCILALLLCTILSSDGFQINPSIRAGVVVQKQQQKYNVVDRKRDFALNLFEKKKEKSATTLAVDEEENWTDFGKSPVTYAYGAAWLLLVSFAFIFAPGELGSPSDTAFLKSILDNPTAPEGVNPFFFGIFNEFALIPIVLGCTISPRTSDEKNVIPVGIPLFLSSFIAFFVIGPYLALRKTPSTEEQVEDDWITQNIWENKIFNYVTVVFGILCLASAAPGFADPAESWKGCLEFIGSSRFAAVSVADLSMITLILTKEVADDYKIRCNPENQDRAGIIGASTALLPILGTAIYCAARPSLPSAANSES